jgi:serine/threonine protein phosphatase PrpC
MNGN